MSRVFVVQRQHKLNRETGILEPKFDLAPAESFGKLVYLLGPSVRPFNSEGIVDDLRSGLRDYRPEDFLLLIGNPALIGWATAVAADVADGLVRVLQWSGTHRKYIEISVDLRFEGCQ